MSEKLYAVKNNDGKYWDFRDREGFWELGCCVGCPTTNDEKDAKNVADEQGGHVVTFVEEPKKVVLSEKQAGIVDTARVSDIPATYISAHTNEYNGKEGLLMNAYVNGYTVAKEKKYVVYKNLGGKHNTDVQYAQAYRSSAHSETFSWTITSWILNDEDINGSSFQFTESEIEHYGLQDCEKEEVTDDAD